MATIGANDQVCANFQRRAIFADGIHSYHSAVFHNDVSALGLHQQMESGISLALRRDKVEEVPLRHERNEFASGRQVAEVGHRNPLVAELGIDLVHFVMRNLEEIFEKSQ